MTIFEEVFDVVEKALNIADKFKNIELKELILALKEALLKEKGEKIALAEENIALKEKLAKIETHNMKFSKEDNCYYDVKEDGTKEGPYCSHCYDAKKLHIRMNEWRRGCYKCQHCDQDIRTSRAFHMGIVLGSTDYNVLC